MKEKRELMECKVVMRPMLKEVMRSKMQTRELAIRGKAHFFSVAGVTSLLALFMGEEEFIITCSQILPIQVA